MLVMMAAAMLMVMPTTKPSCEPFLQGMVDRHNMEEHDDLVLNVVHCSEPHEEEE